MNTKITNEQFIESMSKTFFECGDLVGVPRDKQEAISLLIAWDTYWGYLKRDKGKAREWKRADAVKLIAKRYNLSVRWFRSAEARRLALIQENFLISAMSHYLRRYLSDFPLYIR